jgi:hypothetical protein
VFLTHALATRAAASIVAYHQRREESCRLVRMIGSALSSPWTPRHWLLVLPHLQLSDQVLSAIQCPLGAINLALASLKTGNRVLQQTTFQHYHDGIEYQKRLLAPLLNMPAPPSPDAILAPLIMALSLLEFEILAPSSLHAWRRHARGSLHLLSLLGPEACQTSPFFELYTQLRFITVHTCVKVVDFRLANKFQSYAKLVDEMPSYLEQQEWLQKPFKFHPKSEIDTQLDFMLDTKPLNQTDKDPVKLINDVSTPDESLDTIMMLEADNIVRLRESSLPSSESPDRMMRILQDAGLLCSRMRSQLTPMQAHLACSWILRDCQVVLSRPSTSWRMAMQCVFSIFLVSLLAPSNAQRARASDHFKTWHSQHTIQVMYDADYVH